MRIDVKHVDGLPDGVQRIEQRDGHPMVAAEREDLRSLSPQVTDAGADRGRVVVVAAAGPGDVAHVDAARQQRCKRIVEVEVPLVAAVGNLLRTQANRIRRARLIVGRGSCA